MPLFVAVVPPEWHMWGYSSPPPKKKEFWSLRSLWYLYPTLKIVAPPLGICHHLCQFYCQNRRFGVCWVYGDSKFGIVHWNGWSSLPRIASDLNEWSYGNNKAGGKCWDIWLDSQSTRISLNLRDSCIAGMLIEWLVNELLLVSTVHTWSWLVTI